MDPSVTCSVFTCGVLVLGCEVMAGVDTGFSMSGDWDVSGRTVEAGAASETVDGDAAGVGTVVGVGTGVAVGVGTAAGVGIGVAVGVGVGTITGSTASIHFGNNVISCVIRCV